jgi:predicted nuclease of restriction endonuclease-like (RecB) superfamily
VLYDKIKKTLSYFIEVIDIRQSCFCLPYLDYQVKFDLYAVTLFDISKWCDTVTPTYVDALSTLLFHRFAVSKDGEGIIQLAKQGQIIEDEIDIIKSPYVLEFLGIPEDIRFSESELEQRIIDNLQLFLLELGKGFAFIARQFRIPINNKNFRVDLVFYHRILKCFVLIDLKIHDVEHYDIGQMNMYLNYFATEQNMPDDNPPIGIILAKEKDEVLVEYALGGIANNIFVSKYELYLPDRQLLESRVRRIIDQA